ncbi:Methionine--tRNA ligase [Desulfamplus magnetovallimortis]|uniref:Methionine--tRNA ligase n=1 Tax=Desulfamplus magnetovallimortis TaxID=1246637 RepID=A0A1W1HLB3_9BACT|nr:methionine--tRNA ligase [Desulfamplus magnetovallimortis]SLM33271.1 Methionine--tRNA ligase [Desulfamplus magnetovallimortis]
MNTNDKNCTDKQSIFYTTPIYYVNAKPHLGHAYTTISVDVAARYSRMCGKETYFLTGTDEHGDKIVEAAEKQNKTPEIYTNEISSLFKNLWPTLNISNNDFIRTTNPTHINVVEKLLTRIYESGDIYFSEYEGIYCFGCERFYQERELVDGKCPDHGTEPQNIKEANYFFAMSKYQDWLIDHIKKNPDFIRPERYRNEILSFLKEPLEDLCISRPKSRLTWGITLPFDENYVTYVWFDALTNYISALGFPDGNKFKKFWPGSQHFVAKDIIKPHGIYWPTMLKAAGIDIYQHLNVHGFWNVGGSKMSKSIGNVTDPVEVTQIYGVDQFRYFLMREMVFGLDANFTEDAIVQRINSDLANDLGNVFSRVLAMNHRYFKGKVPEPVKYIEKEKSLSLESSAAETIEAFKMAMGCNEFHKGLIAIWDFISILNKYIDTTAPWVAAKDDARKEELATIIYNLVESLRVVACLVFPVMPETSIKMLDIMDLKNRVKTIKDMDGHSTPSLEGIKSWYQVTPGTEIGKPPLLFPRVDPDKKQNKDQKQDSESEKCSSKALKPEKNSPASLKPQISIEDFAKIDLRVGIIISAEKIKKSNKLMKLSVDLGEDTPRQIVAGIAQNYNPDELQGKQVVVVANLKPAKLMGEASQGMILAGNDGTKLVLTGFTSPLTPGSQVK